MDYPWGLRRDSYNRLLCDGVQAGCFVRFIGSYLKSKNIRV